MLLYNNHFTTSWNLQVKPGINDVKKKGNDSGPVTAQGAGRYPLLRVLLQNLLKLFYRAQIVFDIP